MKDLNKHFTKLDRQIANKHMKKCCTSCVIREMQIKRMRRHCTNIRMSKIQNTDTNCGPGYGAAGTLVTAGGNAKGCSHFGRVRQFLTKLNVLLPYDPAVTPPRFYPNELKTFVHVKTCSQMFLAALFFFFFFFAVQLIYNVVFVSGVQHSDSVIHTYIYSFSYSFPLY